MCGIAGLINFKHSGPDTEVIRKMTNGIAHRGPDAEGYFVNDQVALGHRRLSIIDVSAASNQPMSDYSGRYSIVFNGEIYNYQELRDQLPSYPYKTKSDTEVVLAYYDTFGTDALRKINGMFAFAIWDTIEKRLFVARDRLGKKPFYYFLDHNYFLFSSEIRSLLSSGLVQRKLEVTAIPEYLKYQATMDDHTMVTGVKSLRSGCYATVENGVFTEKQYWSFTEVQPCNDSADAARKIVRDLLMDSVRLRMISDVPIGAFLSGGIDSSLIVACMAEQSSQSINTFNISFDEKEFDESAFAEQIAKQYKTQHHRIVIRPEVFLESMDEILGAMDSPSADGPNTYLVSKFTRKEQIKVALSGLGGDELFAGYDKFKFFRKVMQNRWLLNFPITIRKKIVSSILSTRHGTKLDKIAHLLSLNKWDLSTVYPLLRSSYSEEDIRYIVKQNTSDDHVKGKLAVMDEQTPGMGWLSKATIGEMETYTRDVLLRDTDQMSMAHALEVRAPFFDYRLVEYVLSLPDTIKFPHTPKQLLVESFPGYLPKEISSRPKMGFTLPWNNWLRGPLAGSAEDKMKSLADRKEFNGDAIMNNWNSFQKGDKNMLWSRIWQLYVLSDWLDRQQL